MGIGSGDFVVGEIGGDDSLGEGVVSGEEDVEGCSVEDLLGKGGGGAIANDELYSFGFFVLSCQDGHDGLEVGRGGEAELPGCGSLGGAWLRGAGGEQNASKEAEKDAPKPWCTPVFTVG